MSWHRLSSVLEGALQLHAARHPTMAVAGGMHALSRNVRHACTLVRLPGPGLPRSPSASSESRLSPLCARLLSPMRALLPAQTCMHMMDMRRHEPNAGICCMDTACS